MTEQRYTTEALGWGAGGERPEDPAAEPFKPLTDEEIAELRRLDREGTPVPWEFVEDGVLGPPGSAAPTEDGSEDGEKPSRKAIVETDSGYYGPHGVDRELLPAARNALPRLLDFVERAKLLLKRIERTKLAHYYCPECGGEDGVDHEPGCELAALIG